MTASQNKKGQSSERPTLCIAGNSAAPFVNHRQACLAVINSGMPLSRMEGQFLGGQAFNDSPQSEKQSAWLIRLLDRAGLPPLADRGVS
jgi:hypothetical protein